MASRFRPCAFTPTPSIASPRWRRDYAPVSLGGPFSVTGVEQGSGRRRGAGARVGYRVVATARVFLDARPDRICWPVRGSVGFAWPTAFWSTEAGLRWAWSLVTAALGATVTGWIVTAWNWLLDHIGSVLPGWASPTIPSFEEYPLSGMSALALLAWAFFIWSNKLRAADRGAWPNGPGPATSGLATARPGDGLAQCSYPRTAAHHGGLYRWVWRGMLVPVLGSE